MSLPYDFPEGQLVILAGPSGVGKTSVVKKIIEKVPQVFFSVSVTTRSPRAGERDGVHYHFVSDAQFDQLITDGGLLEWALIHGGLQRSGTPAAPISAALHQNRPVLVEVDLVGADRIKELLPWSQSVFLMPPHWNELKERLSQRGSETAYTLARRLETAKWEMLHSDRFDHNVINYTVDAAADHIVPLLTSQHNHPHHSDSCPPPIITV